MADDDRKINANRPYILDIIFLPDKAFKDEAKELFAVIETGISEYRSVRDKVLEYGMADNQYETYNLWTNEANKMITRMTKEPEKQADQGLTALSDLVAILINVVGVMAYDAIAAKGAVLVIFAFTIPLIYFSVKGGRANYQVNREVSLVERKYNYLREILLDRDYVDERTMFGYSEKLNTEAYNEYKKTYKIRVKTAILWHTKTNFGSIFNACSGLAVILILLKPTLSGSISIGLFIAVINGVFSLTGYLSWGLSNNIDVLFHTGEFTKDLQELLSFSETPEALTEPDPMGIVESIEFINVSFCYPGTEQYILRGLSFKLEKGRHYAFVGANGAGKLCHR